MLSIPSLEEASPLEAMTAPMSFQGGHTRCWEGNANEESDRDKEEMGSCLAPVLSSLARNLASH